MNFIMVSLLALVAILGFRFTHLAGLSAETISAVAASLASVFAALSAFGAIGVLRNQRAWLGVTLRPRTGITVDQRDNFVLRLIPMIKNSGTLPATNVSCEARTLLRYRGDTKEDFPKEWVQLVSDAVIAPNSEIDLHYLIKKSAKFTLGEDLDFLIEIRVRYQSSKSSATLIQNFSIWRISEDGGLPALWSNRFPKTAGEVYIKHGSGYLVEGPRDTAARMRVALSRYLKRWQP